jgi:thiamine-phosphate pyrophosphorylase
MKSTDEPHNNFLSFLSGEVGGASSPGKDWRYLFKLQFITHSDNPEDCYESVQKVLEGGCRWTQLRMKENPMEDIEKTALKIQLLCKKYNAVFLINDHVELCKKINADGVHLGKNDMPPEEARKILGNEFIIGGTCNTFEEINHIKDHVDYVGCGPFRFTSTKKDLAPVLGLKGYLNIIWNCRSRSIHIPIVAIGGITAEDISSILQSGPNGVALSGAILNAEDPEEETRRIVEIINNHII